MSCLWCVAIHAIHLVWAWAWIIKKGDFQDCKLLIMLTLYSASGYLIVGQSSQPYLYYSMLQLLMASSFLVFSKRISGNLIGILFAVMSITGGFSAMGFIPSNLWQGIAFNYWNISAFILHFCLFLSWIFCNDRDLYSWLPNRD